MTDGSNKRAAGSGDRLRAFAFDNGRGYPCVVYSIDSRGCEIELTRDVTLGIALDLHIVGQVVGRLAYVRWQQGTHARLSFEAPAADVVEL